MTFDSHAPIGTGQGVYISATARQVGTDNLTHAIETFRSVRSGVPLAPGQTHCARLPLTKLTAHETRAIEAMSNDRDEVLVRRRDMHWPIRAKSAETNAWAEAVTRYLNGQPHHCAKHDEEDQAGRASVSQETVVPQ